MNRGSYGMIWVVGFGVAFLALRKDFAEMWGLDLSLPFSGWWIAAGLMFLVGVYFMLIGIMEERREEQKYEIH